MTLMQSQPPVLIFAQSGRFLAQSATQAGYRVWVADCFGDQDTLNIAERWQQLDSLATLSKNQILKILSELSQGEHCLLVYGSGIEYCYPILYQLPEHIKLISNTATTIDAIQTPATFFSLLRQLELAYPKTQFKQPDNGDWLAKSSSGFGGTHIQHSKQLKRNNEHNDDYYYQRYIIGTSGSGLFLANGEKAQLLSVNRQYLQACKNSPFRLGGITSPWPISEYHQKQLELAINKITSVTQLYGINSIDFIISDQKQLLILEVNPRISASAELLNSQTLLFQYHVDACNGLLSEKPAAQATSPSIISYIYGDYDVTIPVDMDWPLTCNDIPKAGELILKDNPICTLRFQAKTIKTLQKHCKQISHEITSQLKNSPGYSSSSKL